MTYHSRSWTGSNKWRFDYPQGGAKLIIIHYYRSEEGQIRPITAEAGQAQTNVGLIHRGVPTGGQPDEVAAGLASRDAPRAQGDILVFDFPSAGRTLVLYVTCVGPYTSTRGLNHTPDADSLSAPLALLRVRRRIRMPPWTRPAMISSPWRSTCFSGRPRGRTSFSDVWRASS